MAQKSGKSKGEKPDSVTKKKMIMPVKKAVAKKKGNTGKGKKPAITKKVIVKAKEVKKIKEIKEIKKPVIVLHKFRINIRCRSCSFVDGYTVGEKVCHNCKNEIYEIDKI